MDPRILKLRHYKEVNGRLSPTKELLVSFISENDWGATPKSVEKRKISFPAGNQVSNPKSFSLYHSH